MPSQYEALANRATRPRDHTLARRRGHGSGYALANALPKSGSQERRAGPGPARLADPHSARAGVASQDSGAAQAGTARPRPYIRSGAEIPSRPSALARVIRVASTSARRPAERTGSATSTTFASR